MKEIISKAAKLIDVKTMVTLTFTLVISYLAIRGKISPEAMMDTYKTIIIFYFGTQAMKKVVEKPTDKME